MRIAHIRRDDCAAPSLALSVDGCFFDLRALELAWGAAVLGEDFSARVVGLRGAGIEPILARLLSGDRPSHTRLPLENLLFLPPTSDGASVFVLSDAHDGLLGTAKVDGCRDPRWIVGHDAAVAVPSAPRYGVRFAAGLLVGEELHRASATEARAALIGIGQALMFGGGGQSGPVAIGPTVHLSRQWPDLLARLQLRLEASAAVGKLSVPAGPAFEPSFGRAPAQRVADLSHRRRLLPGDWVVFPRPHEPGLSFDSSTPTTFHLQGDGLLVVETLPRRS